MALIVLIGAQAVGKMTVGKELEQKIDGKLLFNHQTIDLYANFLGYNALTFDLSDQTRKNLFTAFVKNKGNNTTASIIFTVLIDFDCLEDIAFLQDISEIFLQANEPVYFIELVADLQERLKRNTHEARLAAKPSKRDIAFSEQELLTSHENYRLKSKEDELHTLFPKVRTLTIDTTELSPESTAKLIIKQFDLK